MPVPSTPCGGAGQRDLEIYPATYFGVKADGTTNDHSALQSAINRAETDGGAIVQLPPSSVYVEGDITIDSDYVVLRGSGDDTYLSFRDGGLHINGQAAMVLRTVVSDMRINRIGTVGPALRLTGSGWAASPGGGGGVARFRVDDVQVESSTGPALEIAGSFLGTFTNCYWRNGTVGINLVNDPVNDDFAGNALAFIGGEVHSCGQLVSAVNTRGLCFSGVAFEGADTSGVHLGAGVKGVSFNGCYFETNPGWDITIDGALGVDVRGSFFIDGPAGKTTSIDLVSGNGLVVEANYFEGYGAAPVNVQAGATARVEMNAIVS